MSLFASNPRLPKSELTPLQQPSVAVSTPKPEPFTGCVACCIFCNLGCWLFLGLALFAASSMGLFFSLAANPSQDFRIVDGDCKIGDTNMDRRTQEKEVERDSWEAHRCDNSAGTSSTGDYCTIYDCYADYTYEICVPEGHALRTYPAGTSPIELCSACTGSGKNDCVEGDPTYWSCIASLPCLQNAKWNQHTQLNASMHSSDASLTESSKHFDCEVAIRGVSGEHACEGFDYDEKACAGVGCCEYVECPIGSPSRKAGECRSAVAKGDCVVTEFTTKTEAHPSCEVEAETPTFHARVQSSTSTNHRRLAGSKTSTDTALAPPTTATALSTSAAAEPFAAVAVAAAARPPRQGDDDDDDDAGSEGCFDSKVDSKHVCRSHCSYCTNVNTHPSFSEGDEVTCWAPTGSLREGKGPFQEYPYECGSHECIKIHE